MPTGVSAARMGGAAGMTPTVRIVAYMVDMASPQMRALGMQATAMNKKMLASRAGLRGLNVGLRGVETAALASAAAIAATGFSILIASRYTVEFEKQLVNMNSILLENQRVMWNIGKEAVSLSQIYTKSAAEIAEGSYFLASAGLNAQQIMEVLQPTVTLSVATLADYSDVTQTVIQVLKGFGMEMSEASRVGDILAWTVNHSLVTIEKLAEGIKFAMPWVSAAGLDFGELAVAVGVLTDRALEAGIGGRGLRQSLAMMIRSVAGSRRGFEQLGIQLVDTTGNMRPLIEIVDEFRRVYPDMELEAISDMMEALGIRGATAFAHLVLGAEDFRAKLQGVSESAGTATRMANEQMTSIAAQFQLLKQRIIAPFLSEEFRNSLQEIFDALVPIVQQLGFNFAAMVKSIMPSMVNFLELLQKTTPFLQTLMIIFSTFVKILSTLHPGIIQLIWSLALLNKMFHFNTIALGLFVAMTYQEQMATIRGNVVVREYTLLKAMQRTEVAAGAMTMEQASYKAKMLAMSEGIAAKNAMLFRVAMTGLSLSLMSGMGALMAYASGSYALGAALSVLAGAIMAVTVAKTLMHWAGKGPAIVIGIGLAAAATGTFMALGHQMHIEGEKQRAEMNKMKTSMEASMAKAPTLQEGGIVLGEGATPAILHPPEAVIPLGEGGAGIGGITINVMPGGIVTKSAVDYLLAEIEKKQRRERQARRGR